jgi:predicted RNA-binding protein associated with RNAse of E/G family
MPMADDDGLISGLTEEQLITNEEMDGLIKEVRRVRGILRSEDRRFCFARDSGPDSVSTHSSNASRAARTSSPHRVVSSSSLT